MPLAADLFSGTGGFSAAFDDHPDWEVYRVEIREDLEADLHADILDLRVDDLPPADVVLASPPCTYFSRAGNHDAWEDGRPVEPGSRHALLLVYHTLGLIKGLAPRWWFLENPTGRLRQHLGPPTGYVTYCQYGTPYQKPTDLWGQHPPHMEYRTCDRGAPCHERNPSQHSALSPYSNDPLEVAKVPYELSEAILEAVEQARHEPTLEQQTLV